jgi:hypothetical protein
MRIIFHNSTNIQKMISHRSSQIIECNKNPRQMTLKIEFLAQDRHNNVTEINRSMTSQPLPSWLFDLQRQRLMIWLFGVLTTLSTIFQLYHGDQFKWCRKPEYPERNTDHGQGTGKLYHLRLLVESSLFCNLQSRARTHAVLVIGLYELLDPTT